MYNGLRKRDSMRNDDKSDSDLDSLSSGYFKDLSATELYYCVVNKSNGEYDDCLWMNTKIKDFDEVFGMMQTYSQLFTKGTVLDVGCGDGQFSLLFALKFKPKKIVGIDVSKNSLIKASELKNRVLEPEFHEKTNEDIEITRFMAKCPVNILQEKKLKCFDQVYRNNFIRDYRKYTENLINKSEVSELKKSILFKMKNIFNYNEAYKFSCIICLSATKWIGLNFGLSGIRSLFDRLKANLEYKGVLMIDEPSLSSVKKTIKKHRNQGFKQPDFDLHDIVKLLIDEYQFVVIKEKTLVNKRNRRIYILLSL